MNLWGRLGISVAFAAFFGIIMTEALQTTTYYEKFKWHLCTGFFASGVVLFIIGYFLNKGWRAKQLAKHKLDESQHSEEPYVPEDPFLLVNLAYWGVMMVVFAAITVFIIPRPRIIKAAVLPAPVRTNQPAPPKPAPVVTNAAPPVRSFPKLNLQGVSYTKQNPSVLINGKTLYVGDHILEATVVEIGPEGATVQFDGQSRVLVLAK